MPAVGSRTAAARLPLVLGLAIAFTITVLDPLVLSLNLPEVSRALHVPPQYLGLLGGAATLVMASLVLAAGRIGDSFGLKRMLMLGLAVATVANLLAALSPGFGFLLAMRFLAGLGMTPMLGVPLALLKTSVAPGRRPVAIGVLMATDVILCGTAPAVTGWVVAAVGWRFLFLITPLLCLVSLWLIARHVPEAPLRRGGRLDVVGICLIGTTMLALVVSLSAAQNGVFRPQTWGPLAVGVAGVLLFLLHARRTPDPALDLALFRSAPFSVALMATLTVNFLIAGLGIVLGQFGSKVLSLSPEAIGLLYLPGTLLIAGAVILAGRLVGAYTPRPVMAGGLLVMAASALLLAGTAGPTMAVWLIVLVTWLCNLGSVVASASVSETVLSQAPPGQSGTVASVQMGFAVTGAAFGPTVYLLLLNFFFQRQWLADADSRDMSASDAGQAVDAVRSGLAQSPGSTVYDPNLLRQASGLDLGLDFAGGLRLTMLTVSFLPLVVAVAALVLMPRAKGPRARGS
ncbi:MFS transporter [Streptomyces sp. NPDC058735]|uniref:MFS transporter n=1 Tax=unclassified Streptomyces TaxID=2593676 RepID=UPI0036CAB717